MEYYEHFKDLELMPATPVDWVAMYNLFLNATARGRTLKLTAYETLTVRTPFYISSSDGKAHKANNTSVVDGIWLSTSTAANSTGYGQVEGLMSYASWTWTPGAKLYVSAGNVLTETTSTTETVISRAISATEIMIAKSDKFIVSAGLYLDGRDVTDTPAGGSVTTDYSVSATHWIELTGNITLTVSNIPNGGRMVLVVKQGTGGSRLITGWTGIDYWQGGVAPTLTTTVGHFDIITLVKSNDKVFAAATLDFS
jgi:hypothetical protein